MFDLNLIAGIKSRGIQDIIANRPMYRKPYHVYMDRLALLPKGYKTIGFFFNFFKEDVNLTMKHIGRFIAKSGKENQN